MAMEELSRIKYKIETLQNTKNYNLQKLKELEDKMFSSNTDLELVLSSRQYYKKAVDLIYERSIVELKDILNSALKYVFYDENYLIEIELTDKRGKSLNFRLFQDGHPVNLRRGTGKGVRTVISAILHIYYLNSKNSKILMLDEAYSAVSKEYVDKFFEFLTQICKRLDFKIILITHDERFLKYGDKHYIIDRGTVKTHD